MAQPTPYVPATNFSDHSSSQPDVPHDGTDLDAEFAAIRLTLDEVLANLALLQRDDGGLANGIVTSASLDSDLSVGFSPATNWVTATAYGVADLVWQSGVLYYCAVAHTSGTFATDLSGGKWLVVLDLASAIPAVTGIYAGRAVGPLTNAGSPYTLTESSMNGVLFFIDSSGGNVTINLPATSSLVDPDFCRARFVRLDSSNLVTLVANGSDTINFGSTFSIFPAPMCHAEVFAGGGTIWLAVNLSVPLDNSVTTDKILPATIADTDLASNAVTTAKVTDASITTAKVALTQGDDVSSGSGTTTIAMATTSYIKVTATGNITIDITPAPSRPGGFVLEAVNFGAHTITWTGVDRWAGGAAPDLTVSGTDLLGFVCDNDGVVNGYAIGIDMG